MELAMSNNQISVQQDDDNLFRMMYSKNGGGNMTLTNDDLQALANLIDTKLDTKLDQRLQPINFELGKMNNRLDTMDRRLDTMDRRLDAMDNRLDTMENRIEKIESEISSIKTSQIEFRNELKEVKYKVSETYELALEAWGTSKENRVWLESEK